MRKPSPISGYKGYKYLNRGKSWENYVRTHKEQNSEKRQRVTRVWREEHKERSLERDPTIEVARVSIHIRFVWSYE